MNQFSTLTCAALTFAHNHFVASFNVILIENVMIYIRFQRDPYFLQRVKVSVDKVTAL